MNRDPEEELQMSFLGDPLLTLLLIGKGWSSDGAEAGARQGGKMVRVMRLRDRDTEGERHTDVH